MKRYYQYIDDVEEGRVIACDALKKAVARFRSDMAESKKKGSRWIFDEGKADSILDFVECLVQFEEPFTGQPIHLEPWECFFLGQLYGWREKKTGNRRFKKAMLFMGRKQGKTILASSLALYEILFKPGIEAYSLATKQIIANKAFKNLALFIKKNPLLASRLQVFKSPHSIMNPRNASTFVPLSKDSDLDGLNPAYCIIDELAAQGDSTAYNTLTSGMGTRSEPLTVIISTAAASLQNPLIEEYEYAKKILDGSIEDDTFLVAIYEYDKTDRWDDVTLIQKSCPNLGVSVKLDYFVDELKKAKVIPVRALEYKVKYCNLWQAEDATWIPDTLWTRCRTAAKKAAADITEDKLEKAACIIGIDLSTIWDWTAASRYYWLPEIGKYRALHRFYIPGNLVESKAHQENPALRKWIEDGLVVATPGESIDYGFLYRDLDAWLKAYNVLGLTYDPAKAKDLEANYSNKITIMPFPQKSAFLSPAAKAWEKAIVDGQIIDESPVVRWMLSCTINKQHPDSGAYFITKSPVAKARKRIDGVISSMMAFSVLQAQILEIGKKPRIFDLSAINY